VRTSYSKSVQNSVRFNGYLVEGGLFFLGQHVDVIKTLHHFVGLLSSVVYVVFGRRYERATTGCVG